MHRDQRHQVDAARRHERVITVDLFSVANAAIQGVNVNVPATLSRSSGYTTDASGKRSPSYVTPVAVSAQVQAMTGRDLRQVEGLNLNGTLSAIYLTGIVKATERVSASGGDLIAVGGQTFLVAMVLEDWPTWTKVCGTLQNGS